MKPLFPTDDTIRQFLKTIEPRHRHTYKVYACILRGFHRHIVETRAPLSIRAIRAWLEQKILHWPLPIVVHRARLVDRYLDWAKSRGAVAENPFSELRQKYGGCTAPIVCALLCADFKDSLERLRPLPQFGSFLGPEMKRHIDHMQYLGYRAVYQKKMLLRFDRFLQARIDLRGHSLTALVQAWCEFGANPRHVLEAQRCGRILSRAMHRLDPKIPILQIDRNLLRRIVRQSRQPHIYSEKEILRLLEAARTLPSPKAPLRQLSVYTMLAVAYGAGLRRGELARLTLADVCLENATLEIRGTKFFKSRRLPLASSVAEILRRYITARRTAGAPTHPDAGLFWHEHLSGPYSEVSIGQLLTTVIRRAGLKPPRGRQGPRVHDLRHSFVAHRMLQWCRSGVNPQSQLPYLATYLGHKDIRSTLVYLTATEELLQQASNRFRQNSLVALCGDGGSHET